MALIAHIAAILFDLVLSRDQAVLLLVRRRLLLRKDGYSLILPRVSRVGRRRQLRDGRVRGAKLVLADQKVISISLLQAPVLLIELLVLSTDTLIETNIRNNLLIIDSLIISYAFGEAVLSLRLAAFVERGYLVLHARGLVALDGAGQLGDHALALGLIQIVVVRASIVL
jgi:hypothetical protein